MISIQWLLLFSLLCTNFDVCNSFIPTPICWSVRSSSLCDSSDTEDIDFKSIYNIDEKYQQDEALKTGIELTKVMRQVKVDHEEELKSIGNKITQLEEKKAYTILAFWCFDQYVRLGELNAVFKSPTKNVSTEMMKGFDYGLMNACLAKYGMVCDEVKTSNYYHSLEIEWNVSCTLHEDVSENEENV